MSHGARLGLGRQGAPRLAGDDQSHPARHPRSAEGQPAPAASHQPARSLPRRRLNLYGRYAATSLHDNGRVSFASARPWSIASRAPANPLGTCAAVSLGFCRRSAMRLLCIAALILSFGGGPFLVGSARAQAAAQAGDRPGGDYRYFTQRPDTGYVLRECMTACQQDQRCRAFTVVNPNVQGPWMGCWMKDSVPPLVANNCCFSGVIEGR
jgi:PAN domain-containing protein